MPSADASEVLPPLPCLLQGIYPDVLERVVALINSVGIEDPAHNMVHIQAVTDHVRRAVAAEPLDPRRDAVLVLAAMLHEADDPKLFGTSDDFNARKILSECLPSADTAEGAGANTALTLGCAAALADEVCEIIGLVSARKNKDTGVPPGCEWKLIVRDADRIEAIGEVGIARCYAFNEKVGMPLFLKSTPRAMSKEELWTIATPARFASYSGDSASMVDHYYDKLLHLSRCASGSAHLEAKQQSRLQDMIEFVLEFGRTGTIDVAKLEALKEKHCLSKESRRGTKRPAPETGE